MNARASTAWLIGPLLICLLPWELQADTRIDVGLRANALYAAGARINSLHGIGLTSTLNLQDGWFVTAAIDRYDIEIADGIESTSGTTMIRIPVARSHVFGVAVGRRYALQDSRFHWFWSAGIAVGLPSARDGFAVDADGQPAIVRVVQATEIHLTSALGSIRALSEQWSVTAALRAESHFTDLRITEPGVARPIRQASLNPVGVYVSLNYDF